MAETIPLWSLTDDSLVEIGEDGSLVVVTRWGEYDFDRAEPLVRESLRRMALGPVSLANVTSSWEPVECEPDLEGELSWTAEGADALRQALKELGGSVVHSLGLADGKGPLLSVIPVALAPVFEPAGIPAARPTRLSRFCSLRSDAEGMGLESPSARYRVVLYQPWAVHVAATLATAKSTGEIVTMTGIEPGVVGAIVSYLVAAGVVQLAGEQGRFAEDEDPELSLWSPDELLFHTTSRTWRPGGPADLPGLGKPPVVKAANGEGPVYALYRPDLADRAETDPTLTALLENDHTCPEFTESVVSAEQLGEFLFRGARIRSIGPAHMPNGPSHSASQRPYFSVACLYELELYVSVNRCSGLDRGIYHYDPLDHRLSLVNDDEADLDAMLDMAMIGGGNHRRPSALITVTARMPRMASVLGGGAYATTLAHVGALQQTLYLVARAMGLAAHAVPVDAGDRVDRALKLEWPAEVGVGECALDRPA
ncbi:SagB family peptide dehydrogenase [Amycolatopsis sp. BJA-103]|uniref:SagB family peptide dehydrogenase n=1 Tax=Amycolatopsis sp. BJA-103 TaxID=1911175 RepID=UPI000C786811|nr:SagB family peptide dehydrogenase [Amycolatopsis sp. BJA-103]AUI56987.1 SagB-type dehydrogenase domain-containing protein [Amycolatopsis sp. BJA-103]PNE15263.1 SagB-type dehydrogenase domain-containing protein [Amycolatopsis sp. BJA-103]